MTAANDALFQRKEEYKGQLEKVTGKLRTLTPLVEETLPKTQAEVAQLRYNAGKMRENSERVAREAQEAKDRLSNLQTERERETLHVTQKIDSGSLAARTEAARAVQEKNAALRRLAENEAENRRFRDEMKTRGHRVDAENVKLFDELRARLEEAVREKQMLEAENQLIKEREAEARKANLDVATAVEASLKEKEAIRIEKERRERDREREGMGVPPGGLGMEEEEEKVVPPHEEQEEVVPPHEEEVVTEGSETEEENPPVPYVKTGEGVKEEVANFFRQEQEEEELAKTFKVQGPGGEEEEEEEETLLLTANEGGEGEGEEEGEGEGEGEEEGEEEGEGEGEEEEEERLSPRTSTEPEKTLPHRQPTEAEAAKIATLISGLGLFEPPTLIPKARPPLPSTQAPPLPISGTLTVPPLQGKPNWENPGAAPGIPSLNRPLKETPTNAPPEANDPLSVESLPDVKYESLSKGNVNPWVNPVMAGGTLQAGTGTVRNLYRALSREEANLVRFTMDKFNDKISYKDFSSNLGLEGNTNPNVYVNLGLGILNRQSALEGNPEWYGQLVPDLVTKYAREIPRSTKSVIYRVPTFKVTEVAAIIAYMMHLQDQIRHDSTRDTDMAIIGKDLIEAKVFRTPTPTSAGVQMVQNPSHLFNLFHRISLRIRDGIRRGERAQFNMYALTSIINRLQRADLGQGTNNTNTEWSRALKDRLDMAMKSFN